MDFSIDVAIDSVHTMKPATRLFAAVKYLQRGNPTGLTGLYTHGSPRPTLIYIYKRTLEALDKMPESSVYRQSVEALTKQRLSVIEKTIPVGFEEWRERIAKQLPDSDEELRKLAPHFRKTADGTLCIMASYEKPIDEKTDAWDGEPRVPDFTEGPSIDDKSMAAKNAALQNPVTLTRGSVRVEPEPALTAQQYVMLPPATCKV
jgi:NADH dehydrogenase (ubiquinone) 1 alpha subcomplex subunit 5